MKKIAIFAIFLIATIMTFGQLVPDEQYLPTCSVKSTSTHFTKFIPKNTTVKVGTSQYILLADGGVGNSILNMLSKGTCVVDPCCASFPMISASGGTTTIDGNTDVTGKIIVNDGTSGTPDVTGISAYFQNDIKVHGHILGRYDANGLKIGSSFHSGDTLFGKVLYGTSMRLGYGADSTNILISPKGVSVATPSTAASQNVLVGGGGTYLNTASFNTSIGVYSLSQLSTGNCNVAVGGQALANTAAGSYNVAVGTASMALNSTGTGNTAIGEGALEATTNGVSNVAIGIGAMGTSTTGTFDICIGAYSGSKVIGNNKLIISNLIGGQDTAIIYGVMNGTPASNTMQLNAVTQIQKIKLPVSDTTTKISGFVNVGGHIFVGNGTYFKLLY
jgi:hypothetical protein